MKLIYVAMPYGGKKEVEARAAKILQDLNSQEYRIPYRLRKQLPDIEIENKYTYISPVLAFGASYHDLTYEDGIDDCLTLLSRCDALIILGENWAESRGVMAEYAFAQARGIPVLYMPKPEEELEDDTSNKPVRIG
ncbi:DUF4406 domain-containing protein [Megasphaera vaginalis (ex Bordigoni et al. 2020)]|uniref:DUF4406 domain-containing protein n=1 Tax=Megasphaera vaginalis (ex Bordigoni et al. 2020) TaxID=2045301 RepID=UPI000C7BE443|nr:DUF4406 domain-containing protein [Megasphaera vaginalis (ex Bordigoni et al. 2020)]